MSKNKWITTLMAMALLACATAAPAATPYDPAAPQVGISGATLFKNFFKADGSTNDYIDADNNGKYGYMNPPIGGDYVDQLATGWTDYTTTPPASTWFVNYRGVGSGNGFKEMLTFQAVQKATNKAWFPIDTYNGQNGSTNGNPYTVGGNTYGILPVGQSSDDSILNRHAYVNDTGQTYVGTPANPSGIPIKPKSVDIGVMDVPTTWFATNTTGSAAWNRNPGSGGYGTNPLQAWNAPQSNQLKSLSIELVNPANPTQTETVTFNTDGSDPSKQVFDTELAYVPMGIIANRGVNDNQMKMSELQYHFTAGRMPNGENLVAATRDSGSGTRNGSMNSLGIDPSWARGENMDAKTKDKVNAPQLGPQHQTTNLGSSSIMAPVVSNNRLAVGYNGVESTVGKINQGKDLFEHVEVMKDIAGGTAYVAPSIGTILDNGNVNTGWQMGGMETMATVGDPEALAHTPTTDAGIGVAPSLPGTGNTPMINQDAALYIRNITESVDQFISVPGHSSTYFMPGEVLATSFFLKPALEKAPGLTDGVNWTSQTVNETLQSFTMSNHYLATNPPHSYGSLGSWVPSRMSSTYDDGGTQGYQYYADASGTIATLQPEAMLSARNLVQGDFNNDGARDINDAAKLVECVNYSGDATMPNGILKWAYDQADGVMPHIIGDFTGDGNLRADDVRYFADGLAMNSGQLDRIGGFTAVDNAAGGDFFGYASGGLANGTYVAGYARADIAGSDPSNFLFGATPGAGPNGADGNIDGYDINYIQKIVAGAFGPGDTNGNDRLEWSILEEAISMDLSADVDGDWDVDSDDADYLVHTILDSEYGDSDLDGDVDATDLASLGMAWDPAGSSNYWANGDFDGDGDVDATDLATLGMNWAPAGVNPIPEPATLSLLALGGLAIIRRKRG